MDAVESKNIPIFQLLLNNIDEYNTTTKEGNTLVIESIINDSFEILKILCNNNNVDIFRKNHNGWNPIHFASQLGNIAVLDYLLTKGRDYYFEENNRGQTPFEISIIWKKENSFLYFLEFDETEINHQDKDGNTPLHLAVKNMMNQFIQMLTQFDGINFNIQNKKCQTPLHIAVESWCFDIIYEILSFRSCNINLKDNDGLTPFLKAVSLGQTETIKLLINKGINYNETDNNGNTALHLAAKLNNPEIIFILLESNKFNIKQKNNDGRVSYEIAYIYKKTKIIEYFEKFYDIVVVKKETKDSEKEQKIEDVEEEEEEYKSISFQEEEFDSDIDKLLILVPEEEETNDILIKTNEIGKSDDDLSDFQELETEASKTD